MEGDDDGQIDESCQPRTHKKLKKVDNLDNSYSCHEEIDIEDKNPFQVQVILDVLCKLLSFEELKKYRFVSSAWNEVTFSELSKRPQKPINFQTIEELEDDDKFGQLFQLQVRHNEVFPGFHYHQLFSNFSFNIFLLTCPGQIDQFFHHFSPKYVELFGSNDKYYTSLQPPFALAKKEYDDRLKEFFKIFLDKISPTVEEINYNFSQSDFDNEALGEEEDYVQELALTPYPNLRKISCYDDWTRTDLLRIFFYPLIGQNSPKLSHLSFGSFKSRGLGSLEFMKEIWKQSGLLSKLKLLDLSDIDDDTEEEEEPESDLLQVLTEFGQNGLLKLTKLKFENKYSELVKGIFVKLIATQGDTLKILKISTPFSTGRLTFPQDRIRFPALKNLTSLQIDFFSRFEAYFKPINFSLQFPKLVKFTTFDVHTFLAPKFRKVFDEVSGSVKSASFLKDSSQDYSYITNWAPVFDKIYKFFTNLEFLEVDFDFLPKISGVEDVTIPRTEFWTGLKKLVIHCELKNLLHFDMEFLQVIRKFEIVVNCKNDLTDEDFYKDFLGRLMLEEDNMDNSVDLYTRQKFYQKFLNAISDKLRPRQSLLFTIIGYKISEEFKRDFTAIFPDSIFICEPFSRPNDD